MASNVSNAAKPNTMVTRWRKRRDLESTMNTLKKLLEPNNKKGSRKKNKPRNLPKKAIPKRTINRFDSYNSEDDGEFYPNKLKRKGRMKKIGLEPKHVLKVIVATNKRKRRTPHKGLGSQEEEATTGALKVHTPPPLLNQEIMKYELISPPHKSLTEMTVEDLMRMDEDSLSDEDLMEILTCPSPVWWEDPSDDFKKGALYVIESVEKNNGEEPTTEECTQSVSNDTSNTITLKRTPVGEIKCKAKKIAKLENILGHIKSRVLSDNRTTKIDDVKLKNDVEKPTEVDNLVNDEVKSANDSKICEIRDNNDSKTKDTRVRKCSDELDNAKHRTLSSSCSDRSVNEDDLLRNLENIDIPIKNQKTDQMEGNDNTNDAAVKNEVNDDSGVQSDIVDEYIVTTPVIITESKTVIEEVELPEHDKSNVNENNLKDSKLRRKASPLGFLKLDEVILKRLTSNEDILDVRLIQTPTNITNEIKIWSKFDNFTKHHFNTDNFDEVIDVEDEVDCLKIESGENNENNTRDPLELKNDTILIDDDSNDAGTTKKHIIGLDVIKKSNDSNDIQNTEKVLGNNEDINSKDTIVYGNVISVGVKETEDIMQKDLIKPKRKRKCSTSTVSKNPLTSYINAPKNKEIIRIKLLQNETTENIEQPTIVNTTSLNELKTNTKKTNLNHTEKSNEKYKIQNDAIFKIIDPMDNDDLMLRLTDEEVSFIKIPEQAKEKDTENFNQKKTEHIIENNDLSITLIDTKDVEGATIIPLTLPTLTKNSIKPTESPISIKSGSSLEYSEGSISDTNLLFLDEYNDNKIIEEEYLDEESQSIPEDIDQRAELKIISESQQDEEHKDLAQNETNETETGNLDKNIEIEEYLDDDGNSQSTDEESRINNSDENIEHDLDQDENISITEDEDDNRSIEVEYLDDDTQSIGEEVPSENIQGDIHISDKIDQNSDENDKTSVEDSDDQMSRDFDEQIEVNDKNIEPQDNQNKNTSIDTEDSNVESGSTNDLVTVYQIVTNP